MDNLQKNSLKERVKKFLSAERVSNSEFATIANVTPAYVSSIKKNLSFEVLEKLYRINTRVSIAWLLWGYGEMYSNTSTVVKNLQEENAQLKRENAMLQKIVALYERNENAEK